MSEPVLTKYERSRIIGARALQLSSGAPPLLAVNETLSAMQIAIMELENGIIPLVVIR